MGPKEQMREKESEEAVESLTKEIERQMRTGQLREEDIEKYERKVEGAPEKPDQDFFTEEKPE